MSNLSQAEIDAMLQGKAADSKKQTGEIDISAIAENAKNDSFDIMGTGGTSEQEDRGTEDITKYFSPEETDALGEIGNICMGTSATTMNMLLGRRVTITTPKVALYNSEDLLASYKCPFLAISVEFVEGLYGKNLLLLKNYDAALITDLLMGGDGTIDKDNFVLTDIHLSAVSEVMNQMMGSAATAMSNMMGDGINISPPQVAKMAVDECVDKFLDGATPVIKISFDMEIEGLLKSKLLQIMSIDMAKELISSLMHSGEGEEEIKPAPGPARVFNGPDAASHESCAGIPQPRKIAAASALNKNPDVKSVNKNQGVKSVKPVQYQAFDEPEKASPHQDVNIKNFDLINDIPLQVTVELGKTKKNLSDILNLGIGSIIVLDKQAGELVDVIVNGKRIAKGEVVVIDENYGVRITELLSS
ncbi:hypothetical protein SDC9_49966 [bioreactor metagenome]|uniref:Flagellar motor switch protein FliN n=1 Tax=bioreactor metagenome TaxID=1076179 RepID=A0A644WJC2_9ZZZZ